MPWSTASRPASASSAAPSTSFPAPCSRRPSSWLRWGPCFYQQAQDQSGLDLEALSERSLVESFASFPIGLGGGLWYDPGSLGEKRRLFGPYAFWDKGKVVFTWDLNSAEYNYPSQSWYTYALPPDWDRAQSRERSYYWTPPYIDTAGSNALMITVDTFMKDAQGRIVGIATVDWSLEEMLAELNATSALEGSQQFLYDLASGSVLNYSLDNELRMKDVGALPGGLKSLAPQDDKVADYGLLTLGGQPYRLFQVRTQAGFVLGSLVPEAAINQPLSGMVLLNLAASAGLGLVVLGAFALLLRLMFRPVKPLVAAMDRAAKGDLSTVLTVKSNDEFGVLSGHFNTLMRDWQAELDRLGQVIAGSGASSKILLAEADHLQDSCGHIGEAMERFGRQFGELEDRLSRSADESASIDQLVNSEVSQVSAQASSVSSSREAWSGLLSELERLRHQTRQSMEAMDHLTGKAQNSERVMQQTQGSIKEIAHSAQLMGELIHVINSVAAQTNLLAMNAAIEAAHAGDSGKGFSVVASEIRKLAEATAANAKSISQSLQGVIATIRSTESASQETSQVLAELVSGITEVSVQNGEAAGSLERLHASGGRIQDSFDTLERASVEVTNSSSAIKGITAAMNASFQNLGAEASRNRDSVQGLITELDSLGKTAAKLKQVASENRAQGQDLETHLAHFRRS